MRGLMAKPSGEIIETPITRELPRRSLGAAVLHLDARRAQGPGRYGAQDGELGLPHPTPGRRGAGRDRVWTTTAATIDGLVDDTADGRRRQSSSRLRDRIAGSRGAGRTSAIPSPATCWCPRTPRSTSRKAATIRLKRRASSEVLIRSVLTCEYPTRCVRLKCYGRDLRVGKTWSTSAKRWVSSRRSRSASRVPSSPCVRSTYGGAATQRAEAVDNIRGKRNPGTSSSST